MAAWTNSIELCGGIETVSVGAAPWTQQHTFRYRLVAIDTSKDRIQNLAVPLQKSSTPNFAPIVFFSVCIFQNKSCLKVLWQ
jgi:hypothetical protein